MAVGGVHCAFMRAQLLVRSLAENFPYWAQEIGQQINFEFVMKIRAMSQKKRQKKFVKISMTGVAGLKYRLNVYKEKEKREETIHSVFAENR